MIRPLPEDAIIKAAFDLLTDDPAASLGQIAKHAGVGRATLHRYFSGREDLMLALCITAMREMDEAAEAACVDAGSYSDAVKLSLEALIPLGDRYRFLSRESVEDHPEIETEIERQQAETRAMVEGAKDEGLFAPSIPTDWIVQAYDHLLYAAWESVIADEATPKQAAALAWRTLTLGLGADKNDC
ncbi:MAG: helix-turn-helix domain-containing protein [Pseudomonadota bacterium]